MAIVQTPSKGQPLDVEYISLLAQAINSLSKKVSDATSKYTTITSPENNVTKNMKTGDARVVAGFVTVSTKGETSAEAIAFDFSLGQGFKYAPIVTATPSNRGASSKVTDVNVVIDTVTTNRVKGIAYFRKAGNFNMSVNIIAVGIPE